MPRCWLVERDVDSRNLITTTYATRDGERVYRRQAAADALAARGRSITAAVDVDDEELVAAEAEAVERYAAEAERMAAAHDPDDEV